MDFIPFKPQLPDELGQPIVPIQTNMSQSDNFKKDLDINRLKNMFIEKHRLKQLKSDNNTELSYYYDSKSKTVYEVNNFRPVIFMKTNKETSKRITDFNGF